MKPRTYEGMFLFDPAAATQWESVETEVNRIMERADAELIGVKKWDERRLSYEIERRKRGCFVLTYFRAPGSSITGIERDARLSEAILRLLVVRCDLGEEELASFGKDAAEQSEALRKQAAEAAQKEQEREKEKEKEKKAAPPDEDKPAKPIEPEPAAAPEASIEDKAPAPTAPATSEGQADEPEPAQASATPEGDAAQAEPDKTEA